jgi:KaiC/GvpD/RAD55 family RecA-like ATPase
MASLIDTWITLREVETDGRRRRVVRVLKSRGMPHSSRAHDLSITSRGIQVNAISADHEPAGRLVRPRRRMPARRRAEGGSR